MIAVKLALGFSQHGFVLWNVSFAICITNQFPVTSWSMMYLHFM